MEAGEAGSILHHFGASTLHDHAFDIVFTLCYGMFIVLFWLSTRILLQKSIRNRATWMTFAVTLITFLIATLVWATNIAQSTIVTRAYSTDEGNISLEEIIQQSAAASFVPNTAFLWGEYLLPVISDAVVIWRTGILFSQQMRVMICPILLLVATLGTTLAGLGITANLPMLAGIGLQNKIAVNLLDVAVILSCATNALSTFLVFYKLWIYRKFVRNNIPLLNRPPHVQNILVLLVESGLVYLGFQILGMILLSLPTSSPLGSASDLAQVVFGNLYFAFSGMYPSIVVILLHYKNSTEETQNMSALTTSSEVAFRDVEARPATIGHLSFAELHSTTGSNSSQTLDGQADARTQGHQNDGASARTTKSDV